MSVTIFLAPIADKAEGADPKMIFLCPLKFFQLFFTDHFKKFEIVQNCAKQAKEFWVLLRRQKIHNFVQHTFDPCFMVNLCVILF